MSCLKIAALVMLLAVCIVFTANGQGGDTAQVRTTVTDSTGASIPAAKVSMTNEGTGVAVNLPTDQSGLCIFNTLQPASYTVKVQAEGFKAAEQQHVVLRVGQQLDLQFSLEVGAVSQTMVVEGQAPLINTVSGALGTEVTNRYIIDMPLLDRSLTSLSFLAPGVTEVTGASVNTLGGTTFASNGQRYATAEFRLDGGLASAPEGGEGGTTNVSYLPSVEAIQEFKLQNNSFSAEYGNNGGTVVSFVTKSGTNQFHGSGWYFGRRPSFDANDFFSNLAGQPKGVYVHDQYGASVGGPIVKQKLFFFADFERKRDDAPFTIDTSVPTAAQRTGDFSQTYNPDGSLKQIFDPKSATPVMDGGQIVDYTRTPFAGNVIPQSAIDSIGQKLINLYPGGNTPGDSVTGLNNYIAKLVNVQPTWQIDSKVDYYLNQKNRLSGRYSISRSNSDTPDPFLAENINKFNSESGTIEHTWTASPTLVWTNRIGLTRYVNNQRVKRSVDPLSLGFPKDLIYNPWYGDPYVPSITFDDGYQGLVADACCTMTTETDTQWAINSQMIKIINRHNLKFGGERRIFFNNFIQPGNTSGSFNFGPSITASDVYNPNTDAEGSGLASMLVGFPGSGDLSLLPAVANKSSETAFFIQDDWKVNRKLTLNIGVRYEFSTPYTERFNRNQFSCVTCDSGINVPALGAWPGGEIYGTSILASSKMRHANADMNNIAPRLGFAYGLNDKTVIRGGAGVYYGMSYATNWQYGGDTWNKDITLNTTLDSGVTQYATMENPFPAGFVGPEEGKYGALAEWGYNNYNHAGTTNRNAEIYQWNIGFQRQLPGSMLIEVNYSSNRSTHLPWKKSPQNYNFVSTAVREQYGSTGLAQSVPNPFQYLFVGPNAIFNEPDSVYNGDTIPRIDILRPYPQFPGYFGSFPPFAATSRYNALQVRFEKRYSMGLSFTGNYTYSHMTSNSDEGANRWIGALSAGEPQDKNNLAAEQSVSANDTPHRLALAAIYELPVGRGRKYGTHMNRVLDAVIGGWRLNSFVTLQSGQPITVWMARNRLSGGQQRPNLSGSACSGISPQAIINGDGLYFNTDAFSAPADQMAGNAPRYLSGCRVPGIANLDQGIAKQITIREGMFVEVRGEFFNFLNHARFAAPGSAFGSGSFGVISSQGNSPRHGQIGARFVF
ncbi:MAG: carboxypeptidase-like regulatory domain-containing protein [Bryobacteraceae bacterium]